MIGLRKTPKLSVAVPVYEMPNGDFFLERLLHSLKRQTFRDFEIVITRDGKMAENTNSAIKKSKGELIKILYQDDFLAHENALQQIADNFELGWLVTGCTHFDGEEYINDHQPSYNHDIHLINTIGSPSVLTIENYNPIFFDETMTWLLDGEYYRRLFERYGEPTILDDINVVIGLGPHQATNTMGDEVKEREKVYMAQKYDSNK